MAMIAITTSSSINVNAVRFVMPGSMHPAAPHQLLHLLHQRGQFRLRLGGTVRIEFLQSQLADLVLQFRAERRRAVFAVVAGGLVAVSYTHLTLPTIYSV